MTDNTSGPFNALGFRPGEEPARKADDHPGFIVPTPRCNLPASRTVRQIVQSEKALREAVRELLEHPDAVCLPDQILDKLSAALQSETQHG